METILKIEQIEKYYGNRSSLTKALDTISFEVEKGEFIAIMGASGSGKTTLLNCISTLDKVSSGKIYMEGDDITRLKGNQLNRFRREKLGFIFQEFNLLDTLTAFEKSFTGENGRNYRRSTGMGLYIVKKMCGRLGHKIWLESTRGEYTKVTLEFYRSDFDLTKV